MKEIDHNVITFMLFQTGMTLSLSLYTEGDIVQNVHAAFYTTCPLFLQKKCQTDLEQREGEYSKWHNQRTEKVLIF